MAVKLYTNNHLFFFLYDSAYIEILTLWLAWKYHTSYTKHQRNKGKFCHPVLILKRGNLSISRRNSIYNVQNFKCKRWPNNLLQFANWYCHDGPENSLTVVTNVQLLRVYVVAYEQGL